MAHCIINRNGASHIARHLLAAQELKKVAKNEANVISKMRQHTAATHLSLSPLQAAMVLLRGAVAKCRRPRLRVAQDAVAEGAVAGAETQSCAGCCCRVLREGVFHVCQCARPTQKTSA